MSELNVHDRVRIATTIVIVFALILFSALLVQVLNRINDGQRAIVCILSVPDIEEREARQAHCLEEGGL